MRIAPLLFVVVTLSRKRLKTIWKKAQLVTKRWLRENYGVLTEGERSPDYVQGMSEKLRVHLLPFFGDKAVKTRTSKVGAGQAGKETEAAKEQPAPR